MRGDGLADGLQCADPASLVVRVSIALEIKGVDIIKFFCRKRARGRIMNQEAISMRLDKSGPRIVDILQELLEHAKEFLLVRLNCLKGWQCAVSGYRRL